MTSLTEVLSLCKWEVWVYLKSQIHSIHYLAMLFREVIAFSGQNEGSAYHIGICFHEKGTPPFHASVRCYPQYSPFTENRTCFFTSTLILPGGGVGSPRNHPAHYTCKRSTAHLRISTQIEDSPTIERRYYSFRRSWSINVATYLLCWRFAIVQGRISSDVDIDGHMVLHHGSAHRFWLSYSYFSHFCSA